jgi:hypothetical protein
MPVGRHVLPDIALFVELKSGGAHQAGGEQRPELAPVAAAGAGEVAEDVPAVGVEQGVGEVGGLLTAEGVLLRPVDGFGHAQDTVVVGDGGEHGVEGGEPTGRLESYPPGVSFADEPEAGDRAVVFGAG